MNILDATILLLLLWGVWKGYRRGFILQVIYLFGFLIALVVSFRYYKDFSPYLKAWIPYPKADEGAGRLIWMQLIDTETLYYSFLAFVILFIATKILLQIIAKLLNLVALLPGLNMVNRWLGLCLGFVEMLLISLIGIHLLTILPWDKGQEWLAESTLAIWLIEETRFIFTFF